MIAPSFLQMRKLRLHQVKQLAQGHATIKKWLWFKPRQSITESPPLHCPAVLPSQRAWITRLDIYRLFFFNRQDGRNSSETAVSAYRQTSCPSDIWSTSLSSLLWLNLSPKAKVTVGWSSFREPLESCFFISQKFQRTWGKNPEDFRTS